MVNDVNTATYTTSMLYIAPLNGEIFPCFLSTPLICVLSGVLFFDDVTTRVVPGVIQQAYFGDQLKYNWHRLMTSIDDVD